MTPLGCGRRYLEDELSPLPATIKKPLLSRASVEISAGPAVLSALGSSMLRDTVVQVRHRVAE